MCVCVCACACVLFVCVFVCVCVFSYHVFVKRSTSHHHQKSWLFSKNLLIINCYHHLYWWIGFVNLQKKLLFKSHAMRSMLKPFYLLLFFAYLGFIAFQMNLFISGHYHPPIKFLVDNTIAILHEKYIIHYFQNEIKLQYLCLPMLYWLPLHGLHRRTNDTVYLLKL